MIHAVAVVFPTDLQDSPVLPGQEDALHGLGMCVVGCDDRAGQRQILPVSGLGVESVHFERDVLRDYVEGEPVVGEVVGQSQEPFSREPDAKLLARGQVGGGREDQLPGADEGRRAFDRGFEDECPARGTADEVFAGHVPGELDSDLFAFGDRPVGARADQRSPARVQRRARRIGASEAATPCEGGCQAGEQCEAVRERIHGRAPGGGRAVPGGP